MVLPKPEAGESEQDFVSRCISEVQGEFDSQEQRAAVCYAQFRKDSIDGPGRELEVTRTDVSTLPEPVYTEEGFLRAPATRVARCGVQEYRRADGVVQRELRLPEMVFEADSLASLHGKPICRDHPQERVDASNARRLQRGTVTDPREDGEFLAADLIVHDGETVEAIRGGEAEISLGYKTRLVPIAGGVFRKPGHRYDGAKADYLQTRIRHNHLAVLPRGRANEGLGDRPVRIRTRADTSDYRLDAAGNQVRAPQSKEKRDSSMAMIKIGETEYDVPDAVAEHMAMLQTKASGAEKKASEQEAKADAAAAKLEAVEKQARDAAEADKSVERFNLMKRAEGLVKRPLAEIARMDDAALRRSILQARCPTLKLDGKDDGYVAAYLDREFEEDKKKKNSAAELRSAGFGTRRKDGEESPLLKAYADREARRTGRAETKE